MTKLQEGQMVIWTWGEGEATGEIQSIFEKTVTRTIDGTDVVRNGTRDNPALYIVRDDGNNVLKLASEVKAA